MSASGRLVTNHRILGFAHWDEAQEAAFARVPGVPLLWAREHTLRTTVSGPEPTTLLRSHGLTVPTISKVIAGLNSDLLTSGILRKPTSNIF